MLGALSGRQMTPLITSSFKLFIVKVMMIMAMVVLVMILMTKMAMIVEVMRENEQAYKKTDSYVTTLIYMLHGLLCCAILRVVHASKFVSQNILEMSKIYVTIAQSKHLSI